ncbi:MAG TPA: efflux RND transporter periplasmic adaptor subunit [Anaerolineales bacterium]|nr:efflux RND transporter periplasmic adaptor subunit [Anaerolineales bacterium]
MSRFGAGLKEIPALIRNHTGRWRILLPALAIIAVAAAAAYYYVAVYRPAHSVTEVPLQTTSAFKSDLTVSAQGTGILQPATEVQLGFGTSGKLAALNVKPGTQVKEGQLLAQLDNTAQQVKYQVAQRALADFTSPASIAQAEEDVATATDALTNAKYALMQVISPAVFHSQQAVQADQEALSAAQAAAGSSPTADQQKAIDDAQAQLKKDQAELAGNLIWYKEIYVPLNYTVMKPDPSSASRSHRPVKIVEGPTDLEIEQSQANYDVAKTTLQQAQWYLDALSGRDVPANAGGTKLAAYQAAKFAVQSAKATLDGTQISAPMAGTILTVSAQIGDNVGSTPIIVVGDLGGLYVKTYVNEKDYQKYQIGDEADIVFDAMPGKTFQGKVVQVDPGLDTSTSTSVVSGLVEMDPTDEHLLMGMSAAVDIIVARTHDAVLVPLAALHEYSPGKYAVFVMRNGKLSVDFVQVGLKDSTNAEITSGLKAGDVVSTGLVGNK